ncbi:MAG: metallophosphoesterase [Bdellovibrionota bacterium]
MHTRLLIFLLTGSTLMLITLSYVARRLRPWLGRSVWILAALFFALQFAAPIASRQGIKPAITVPLEWLAYGLLGFFLILFFLFTFKDLGAGARRLLSGKVAGKVAPGRREFLQRLGPQGLVGAAGVMSAAGLYQARRTPELKNVRVPIAGLAPALEGFRIVQISDLHVGQTIRREFVERVVEAANSVKADLIALTGDFVDGHVEEIRDQVAPLAHLKARHGLFYITGNHEYYWGAEEWMREFTRLGATPLRNEHKVLDHDGAKFIVAGVEDTSSGVSDPVRALLGAPDAQFRLMLAHQPKSTLEVAKTSAELQLSGHTHGGQFWPWAVFVYLTQFYTRGLHHHEGKLWVYVNSGTGYWGPPNRFGVSSEISVITLTKA